MSVNLYASPIGKYIAQDKGKPLPKTTLASSFFRDIPIKLANLGFTDNYSSSKTATTSYSPSSSSFSLSINNSSSSDISIYLSNSSNPTSGNSCRIEMGSTSGDAETASCNASLDTSEPVYLFITNEPMFSVSGYADLSSSEIIYYCNGSNATYINSTQNYLLTDIHYNLLVSNSSTCQFS